MSMNFNEAMNPETAAFIREKFSEQIEEMDERTVLMKNFDVIKQEDMREVANTAKQPVSVELHDKGDIKTMSDGSRYEVTAQGWRKV